jgi:hypothetical protein
MTRSFARSVHRRLIIHHGQPAREPELVDTTEVDTTELPPHHGITYERV